ncbi:MAG: hypothetical protein EA385_15765 [Salinarimonadaceae bacterium]|nr:MAG: hypothetical protein EA385_15765 [Salinarimonadaceae bacterium]
MSTQMNLTLATFTPGEAERIGPLATNMQRDWRRRGFIPPSPFDCFALAEMQALKALADRGIGPQVAKDVSSICAMGIVWSALGWREAIDGDLSRLLDDLPDDVKDAQAQSVREALDAIAERQGQAITEPTDPHWGYKTRRVKNALWKSRGFPRVLPGRFFIWWADGSHLWHTSLEQAFDDLSSSDPRLAGPALVLDLDALGSTLLDRAGRPLVHVEIYDEESETETAIDCRDDKPGPQMEPTS